MITEEFKKACEDCKAAEKFKTPIESHKLEFTDEEIQQVAGGKDYEGALDKKVYG